MPSLTPSPVSTMSSSNSLHSAMGSSSSSNTNARAGPSNFSSGSAPPAEREGGHGSSSSNHAQAQSATAAQQQQQQQQKQPPAFEFMKRKKWADLLVSELSEAIILVLSTSCKILFCGHAVQELLGSRDEDLVDCDLVDLMNANDKDSFREMFSQSIAQKKDLLTYARLRCTSEYYGGSDYTVPHKEILFEIMGYPHFLPGEEECKCFFAVAKPYPSRNTAMMNTFLELKVENARLQERLQALRVRSQELSKNQFTRGPLKFSNGAMSAQLAANLGFDSAPEYAQSSYYHSVPAHGYGASAMGYLPQVEEDADDKRAAKRPKKVYMTDQYVCVTCGRTDSPEWRKGPQGPKTLCNACGLRWAKKVRKFEEANEAGGDASQKVLDKTVPP